MILLILDSETTGLPDNAEAKPIEVGAILYDTETKATLQTYQSLLNGVDNPCEDINHIKPASLQVMKVYDNKTLTAPLQIMADYADYVIAHNAEFDKGMLERIDVTFTKPWVCSKNDIKYPGNHKSTRLGHLAYDMGVEIRKAHSALGDAEMLLNLLLTVPDLEQQFKDSAIPKVLVKALTSYEERDLPKKAGFNWNGAKKHWEGKVAETAIESLGFKVTRL